MASLSHVQRVRLLYKTILRLHRGLPEEVQSLGTSYLKDEFKRHKTCNEAEAAIFLHEWTEYALMLANQLGLKGPHTAKPLGQDLDKKDLEKFRDEQMCQLYELMITATGKDSKNKKD
ncbi:succinate dehydrogenase assembly factor 3 [Megalopta genalis]|uniref:succinate dehydrogenase assembly factor 3 n=1 Tax=Megalopta genalis TaxID=115081 RepID=UPI001442F67D|nr:succinate dehydrogenase assembly factor 3, mitochondrial [Megalopta genalis]